MVYSFHGHDDVHSPQWFTPFMAMMMYTVPSGVLLLWPWWCTQSPVVYSFHGHDDVHNAQWPCGSPGPRRPPELKHQAGKRTKGKSWQTHTIGQTPPAIVSPSVIRVFHRLLFGPPDTFHPDSPDGPSHLRLLWLTFTPPTDLQISDSLDWPSHLRLNLRPLTPLTDLQTSDSPYWPSDLRLPDWPSDLWLPWLTFTPGENSGGISNAPVDLDLKGELSDSAEPKYADWWARGSHCFWIAVAPGPDPPPASFWGSW